MTLNTFHLWLVYVMHILVFTAINLCSKTQVLSFAHSKDDGAPKF